VATSTFEQHLTRRRRNRRAWIVYAIPGVLLVVRTLFDFAFDGATGHVVGFFGRLTGGSTPLMAIAGLLTVAYLPLAIGVGLEDRRRWYGQVALSRHDTGVIHMTTRVRSTSGSRHELARRPFGHWVRRTPLAIAFLVAILFWPLTGAAMGAHWVLLDGGTAFEFGWRIGLVAAAAGVLIVLAEPWISAASWGSHRTVRLATNVLPLLAVAAALIIT
jgi:hypothetical protein